MAERVDELDVEHPLRDGDAAALLASDLGHRRLGAVVPFEAPRLGEQAVGREDLESRILGRDEHGQHLRARRRPLLLGERERRLVAVVAVGDQQLLVVEGANERRVVQSPQLRALHREVGLALRPRRRRGAVVEEDRLELDARRAEQTQAAFLWARMRPLVRQDRPRLVGLDPGDTTIPKRVRATPSGPR